MRSSSRARFSASASHHPRCSMYLHPDTPKDKESLYKPWVKNVG